MIPISGSVYLLPEEVVLNAIRAQGSGGQNVNKVSSAIHLRFDVRSSSLPTDVKDKVLRMPDHRINTDGVIVIKAQQHRTQELNKADAIERLTEMLKKALTVQKKRRATKPTRSSQTKRLNKKKLQGKTKQLRQKVTDY